MSFNSNLNALTEFKENFIDNPAANLFNEIMIRKLEIMKGKQERFEEQQKIKTELLVAVKEDISKQKTSLEKQLNDERKYSEKLEERIQSINKNYSDLLKKTEENNQRFVIKINDVINESQLLRKENTELRSKTKEKEDLILVLEETLSKAKLTNSTRNLNSKNEQEELNEIYLKCETEKSLENRLKNSIDISEGYLKKYTNGLEETVSRLSRQIETADYRIDCLKDVSQLSEKSNEPDVDYLLREIDSLSLKIQELTQKNQLLINENLEKQIEISQKNQHLADQNAKNQSETSEKLNKIYSLEQENSSLVEQSNSLLASLNETKGLLSACQEANKELSQKLEDTEIAKEKLEKEMNEYKCKLMQNAKLESSAIDDVDLALEKYFSEQGLEVLFVKLSTGLYVYGTKKVNVSLKGPKIVCRSNGRYYPIDEFLKSSLDQAPIFNPNRGQYTTRHIKTSSLSSHFVSPANKSRSRFSFDFEIDSGNSRLSKPNKSRK